MKMPKSIVFLILTFLLSWPVAFCAFSSGMVPYSGRWFAVAVFFMFTPAISAVVTQRFLFRDELIRPLGISFRPTRWFLVAALLPAFLAVGSTAVSYLFPAVSLTSDPMQSNALLLFGPSLSETQLAELRRSATELPLHPFILILISGTVAGLTVNGIAGFGEELGWRGFLLRETGRLGFWGSSLVIGIIWGLWHIPFIIHGHNYPGHPVAGIFMMVLWTVLFAPLIAYVRIRSNSVVSAAIMHGVLNGTAMAPAAVLRGGDSLETGVMGLAGMLVLCGLNLVLLGFGGARVWHERWMAHGFCGDIAAEEPLVCGRHIPAIKEQANG